MITATHKDNQITRNASFFKKIPKPLRNLTHDPPEYSSSEDEGHMHVTASPKSKENQGQHSSNLRRSGRTRRPPKRFDC